MSFFCVLNSNKCNVIFSIVILITCVFNLICAPLVVYKIDDWSNAMSTSLSILQSRIVAIATFISRGFILYNIKFDKNRKYKMTLESFDIYSPITIVALNQCKYFSIIILTLCLTFILPINLTKLYNIYYNHPDGFLVTMYFSFFYLQNLSMCFIENHFIKQCFMIYKQFIEINDDLRKIKTEYNNVNKFPFIGETTGSGRSQLKIIPSCIIYDKDFYCPKDKKHPLANTMELLKIRHWLIREAIIDLNYLFGIHLGLSILSLSVQLLFDIYTDLFHYFTTRYDVTIFRSKLLFFGWILQYSFRFCMITITPNITIKQATNAKTLITDINNRYLDSSTKEELQLFYTQISSRSTEFTACDLFTLNTRLITSAIAAGATYLVILVQFHSGKD